MRDLWNKIWEYRNGRWWLSPVWICMFMVRCIVRSVRTASSICRKIVNKLKQVIFLRRLNQVVQKHKKLSSPVPVAYSTPMKEQNWPDRPGAYVRLDYWVKISSGGSYGHTCYVAQELDRKSPGLICIMGYRYTLLDEMGIKQKVLAPKLATTGVASIITQGHEYEKALMRQIKALRPSFIYERLCLGSLAAARASRMFGIPYIVEYNGSELEMSRSFSGHILEYADILEDIENYSLNQATAISAISEQVKHSLVARGIDSGRICVNPNGVDTDDYCPLPEKQKQALREELGFKREDVVLCFIGTFGGWHGVDVLVAAIPQVLKAAANARFLLIGDGNFKHLADECVLQHHLQDKVVFTGLVPQAEGRKYMQAADIFLSPHSSHMKTMRFFGSPTKLFEYMGLGGGIIASDLEQISKILRPALHAHTLDSNAGIDGERAILCSPGNVDEFVTACIFMINNPEVRQKLGTNARLAAKNNFTWQSHVERLWRFVNGDKSASWEEDQIISVQSNKHVNNNTTDNSTQPQEQAGIEAQNQWNTNPCGAVEGLENLDLDYFLRVEENRYRAESFILEKAPFKLFNNKKVLEIGCGHGTDSAQFAKHGAFCHVIDITDSHLELTRKNFEFRGMPLEWKKCDATAIAYPDAYFDCIYSHGVIHHIENVDKVLQEVKRVLKPGGTFYVVVYNQLSAFHFFSKILSDGIIGLRLFFLGYKGLLSTIEYGADGMRLRPYVKLYRKGQLRRMLQRTGFTVSDVGVANLMPSHFERWQGKFWPKWQKYEDKIGWYVYALAKRP